ncbi:MAG: hypothetical protein KBS34_05230, partial [Phascolarctobacterium sp.]|nr:hypothetical protein [Candidatus Phascolarctobacterium equi]
MGFGITMAVCFLYLLWMGLLTWIFGSPLDADFTAKLSAGIVFFSIICIVVYDPGKEREKKFYKDSNFLTPIC